MPAEMRHEGSPGQRVGEFEENDAEDATESSTPPQAAVRDPYSIESNGTGEMSSEGGRAPTSAAEQELETQLETAMRRCDMLEAQNSALWLVRN